MLSMLPRDTVNRLLLNGARHHERKAVFIAGGVEDPDWRSDRLSIRIALALEEVLFVGRGDLVALWMPLSIEWALVERALWGLGAVSLAILPDGDPAGVSRALRDGSPRAVFTSTPEIVPSRDVPIVSLEKGRGGAHPALADLLDRGGILDTPERASAFRAKAREVPPRAPASLEAEDGRALSQGEWAKRIESFFARCPPQRGARRALSTRRAGLSARLEIYAGWADGLTTLVFENGGNRG